ncbi:MAG TPA: DeoR/GlpR family DNA-binding transcription regulator [Symbiobacteriaceae bacterium]
MLAAQRKRMILTLLEQQQHLRVSEIAALLGISEVTARKDLRELEAEGLLRRVHGGAVTPGYAALEPSLADKASQNLEEKRQIAQCAARLVQDGQVVALNAGTTTLEVARRLAARSNLTVVTNAVNIGAELAGRPGIRLILTGGIVRERSFAMVGPLAEQTLRELRTDLAIIGINGIDPHYGLTTPDVVEAATNRALIQSARQVVVVADHSKFGQVSLSRICPMDQVDVVITDSATPARYREALEQQGIRVILADQPEARSQPNES